MPKKSAIPLEVISDVRLFAGDKVRLQNLYPTLGYGQAIRRLVRQHLEIAEAKLRQELKSTDLS